VTDQVVLYSNGCRWDAAGHGVESFDHGLYGLLICPRHVAAPLLHNAGYVQASATQIKAEVTMLQARISALQAFL
jgi:hypothetical protein